LTGRPPRNVAHSVHRRLLNKAREAGRPFNELLQYYAMERFLYRLSRSAHAGRFVLKGALMLVMWRALVTRPTRDIDLLGRMDNSPEAVAALMREVCAQEVEPDGLQFDPSTVEARAIAENAAYSGVRGRFQGRLGKALIHMQVDVGFGDVIHALPPTARYPTILDLPAPRIRGYSRESAVAEKFQAMVELGELNSRMRDFYDVWLLSRQFDFRGEVLTEAVRRTFAARGTGIPACPVAFTNGFARDETKQAQWRAFLRRSRIENAPRSFAEVVAAVAALLRPVLSALSEGKSFRNVWKAPGPWR